MNIHDHLIWFGHVIYSGARGLFKTIVCMMLTVLFMSPGMIIVRVALLLVHNPTVQDIIVMIYGLAAFPVAFYYASRIMNIRT